MTRDPYVWIDPWAALDGLLIIPDLEWSPEDIAAMQRPGVVQFVPNRIEVTRFDAKTQDERDRLCLATGGVAGGIVDLGDGRFMASARAPTPDRSVPIWLLAIIMLGIAFGAPMILGWVW